MERRALHVAVAERIDLGLRARLDAERVVVGDAPVVGEPNDLPGVIVELLRAVLLAAVAEGDVEQAVSVEYEARPEMSAAARFRFGAENHAHLDELVALQ